jgi:hypothetical protein
VMGRLIECSLEAPEPTKYFAVCEHHVTR